MIGIFYIFPNFLSIQKQENTCRNFLKKITDIFGDLTYNNCQFILIILRKNFMTNNTENLNNSDNQNADIISQFFNPSEQKTERAEDFRTGYVAIVGRPNVGKSTLMNHILGQKLSITSRKPQTTRHRITGIFTDEKMQAIFVDTPGIHAKEVRVINERMNQTATSALADVDVVLFVIDSLKWVGDDELVFQKLQNLSVPVIAVINKSDTIKQKGELFPLLEKLHNTGVFSDVVPISALRGHNLTELLNVIEKYLPIAEPIYDAEQITDRSERFLASEIIREKVMRTSGDEIPYDLTVQIDSFKDEPAHQDPKTGKWRRAVTFIDATIFVERRGQKVIIIGDKGEKIKQIGMDARLDMEKMFEKKVMLTLWVKVKKGWSDDDRALTSLGY